MQTKKISLFAAGAAILASTATAGYVGLSTGYLIDSEEAYFATRLGYTLSEQANLAHNLEIEVGYTSTAESWMDIDILPLMVNYRFETFVDDSWVFGVGAGAGMARVKLSGGGYSDSDWGWTVQSFASAGYRVSDRFELALAVRYFYVGEVELFGLRDDLGDDISIELGANFRF